MSTTVDTQLLADVTKAASRNAGWYGPTYLKEAASLLGELLEAGQRHGVAPSEWDNVANLPAAAVDVLWRQDRYYKKPETAAAVIALLQHAENALAANHGVTAERPAEWTLALPRVDTSPRMGRDGDAQLVIAIDGTGGWMLTMHDPRAVGMTRMNTVYATFDAAGAAEVAEIAVQVNRDPRNPFPLR
ncbi:hypothetical protein [Amycolatopsis kentuckyensis]|uniref:hypothetical protein n=1 Tax=Amycolatopsis kentuckyensis TaxID=218823 RepID=UPI00356AB4CE